MNLVKILLIVVTSGLIGYITNVLAIKSLFRPLDPVKLGPFTFQGLIPKRRLEVSSSIGKTVAQELLSEDDLISQLISQEDEDRFREILTVKIQQMVLGKLAFLPSPIRNRIMEAIEEKMDKEVPQLFEEVTTLAEDHIRNKVNIGALVEEKINAFDLETLESLTLEIAGKELRAIEWLGMVMGAGIGLIQGLIMTYLG